jgi:hypothetical protein
LGTSLAALVGIFGSCGGELAHEPRKWRLLGTHTWTGYLYPSGLPHLGKWNASQQMNITLVDSKLRISPPLEVADSPVFTNVEHCESHFMPSINIDISGIIESASRVGMAGIRRES